MFHINGDDEDSQDGTLTICLVPQMVKSIEMHYQDMLPLPHASEDVLDELMDVQMTVGSQWLLSTTPSIARNLNTTIKTGQGNS